jgi:hypothetical protein
VNSTQTLNRDKRIAIALIDHTVIVAIMLDLREKPKEILMNHFTCMILVNQIRYRYLRAIEYVWARTVVAWNDRRHWGGEAGRRGWLGEGEHWVRVMGSFLEVARVRDCEVCRSYG